MKYDVAIVGGGPAGLQAAIELAKYNVSILIIEETQFLGGKLLSQVHEEEKGNWWIGRNIAAKLVNEISKYQNIDIKLGVQVWNIENEYKLYLSKVDGSEVLEEIECEYIILATGAIEKGLPMPGWTLSRVLTVGGAQVLNNQYLIKPGNRVALIGIDILSLAVARSMKMSGVDVVGIFMPPKNPFTKNLALPKEVMNKFSSMGDHAPNFILKAGMKFIQKDSRKKLAYKFYPSKGMKVWGVPIFMNKSIHKIYGNGQVEGVEVSKIDFYGNFVKNVGSIKVDTVCISGGLTPQTELAVILNCEFLNIEGLSGKVPLHNQYLETTVKNVYVAGNITGIEGAKVCIAQGSLAASSILFKMRKLESEIQLQNNIYEVIQTREKSLIQFNKQIAEGRKKMQSQWETKFII